MPDPPISAIIPTYNGATRGFLAEAIESVLSQTYRNFELIIVDDGSADGTRALCERYLVDKRVRVLSQRNRGLGAARNLGIEDARGEYVCFLDDDDLWKPEKLNKQVVFMLECLGRDAATGMVFHSSNLIDAGGEVIGQRRHVVGGKIRDDLLMDCVVDGICSVMVPREVFEVVGFFAEWKPLGAEDLDFFLRISERFHVYSDGELLSDIRTHSTGQMSSAKRAQELGVSCALWRALTNGTLALQNKVFGNLYRGFAMWHFRDGEYDECRRCYVIARHYDRVGWRLRIAYWAAHFPLTLDWIKNGFPDFWSMFRNRPQ